MYLEEQETIAKGVLIRDARVLILRRANKFVKKNSPWEWDLPGGHIEPSETPGEALSREAMEEVSLALGALTEVHTGSRTAFFYCTDWEGDIKLSHEHQDYKWINPEDIGNYYIGVDYRTAVRKAVKEIS